MKGFTLVEILVVITIMGILATLGIINYRTFQATQVLNEGVSLLQSTLRAAQSNATAAVKCGNLGAATWMVTFGSNSSFSLQCNTPTSSTLSPRNYNLPENIQISSISSVSCEAAGYPFAVSFSPLFGAVRFESATACIASQSSITFRLTNTKSGESKGVTVTSGGGIDATN